MKKTKQRKLTKVERKMSDTYLKLYDLLEDNLTDMQLAGFPQVQAIVANIKKR